MLRIMALLALTLSLAVLRAEDFQITPDVQTDLDQQKTEIAKWAADPVLASAVKDQNTKGPLVGMDNATWKSTKRSDPIVKAFQDNAAGKFLAEKIKASGGVYVEAFLSGSEGEKVAFAEKTTFYLHKGKPKFDEPFSSGKAWQGKPEFDESSQAYAIQISVPVLDGTKSIGVLVVGISLSKYAKK